jgi:hypothetical protein
MPKIGSKYPVILNELVILAIKTPLRDTIRKMIPRVKKM